MLTEELRREMPRERLLEKGIDALSFEELICLVLGSGTVKYNIFDLSQGVSRLLKQVRNPSLEDLLLIPGMGLAKSSKLLAALELSRRFNLLQSTQNRGFSVSQQVFSYIQTKMHGRSEEQFYVIYLDSKNRPLHDFCVAKGNELFVQFSMKKLFQRIGFPGVVSIICIHNHPSGDVQPSKQDKQLTLKISQACHLMDIQLLDHLIVGSKSEYFSFKDQGLL